MKITREDFYKKNFIRRNTSLESNPITLFLKNNRLFAFKVEDIRMAIPNKNSYTLRGTLRQLLKRGVVVHDAPYWMWKDDEESIILTKKKKEVKLKNADKQKRF